MSKKHIVIVGAGPGGLTAGMLLAHAGHKVTILEKDKVVGGRNQPIKLGPYTFDTGPTFLMMKFVLDEVFAETGRKTKDYLETVNLDPMYELHYPDLVFAPSSNKKKMIATFKKQFPDEVEGLMRFYEKETERFGKMFGCLRIPYSKKTSFLKRQFIRAIPYFKIPRSLYGNLASYFKDERLRLSFTFQSKYLGMSPWECPAAFTIIPYVEHKFGVYHVIGGLNKISEAMAKVVKEEGGKIKLGTGVKKLIIKDGKATGVKLKNGKTILADEVIINADFANSVSKMIDKKHLSTWHPRKLQKKRFSCSTFMLYLGLDKTYRKLHHNTIVIPNNYKSFINNLFKNRKVTEELAFYIQNASVTDKTVAPKGHSAMYVLVPVPNNRSKINWTKNKEAFTEKVLNQMIDRLNLKDLRKHIKQKKIITPTDWEKTYNVHLGATFNLAHNLDQMLYFRPHNKFQDVKNVYLVGGGTHPGSGLPTIYESGRISAKMILGKL